MEKDKLTFESLLGYFSSKVGVSSEEWNKMSQKDKMREAVNVANDIVSKKENTELMTIKEL